MTENHSENTWQIEVAGLVYEASADELPDWINEGSLQPDDMVRKGNLRWIEAAKVPYLVPFFNAKASGTGTKAVGIADMRAHAVFSDHLHDPVPDPEAAEKPAPVLRINNFYGVAEIEAGVDDCVLHVGVPSFYLCGECRGRFCKGCPSSYGGNVKICPACGALCKPLSEVSLEASKVRETARALAGGFGFGDLMTAFAHPFSFKPSLIMGSMMFAIFTLGRSASALGGIVLFASSLICIMLANMLTFGVLSNTVNNFSKGELAKNFMPDFEDFSLWDDVIHPFFLSIGVYASSFGPFLITAAIGFYLIFSSINSQARAIQSDLERIPGTQYYSAKDTVQQSEQVKGVLRSIADEQERRLEETEKVATTGQVATESRPQEVPENVVQQAAEAERAKLESVVGKTAETRAQENQAFLKNFLQLAPPLVVIGLIALIWGLFYYPAACAVAGYTRSFMATINPLVGLDTIRRLGGNYIKLLLMGAVLIVASGVVSTLLSAVFSAFDLPGMGNLPATFLNALFTFYIFVVFSCVLGMALFKSADKLKLPT